MPIHFLWGDEDFLIEKAVNKLRKEKGWTQIELAEKLNVSDKAVSKWEKDVGNPSVEFFPLLASLFNVSIDFLMTGNKQEDILLNSSNIIKDKKGEVKMITEQYLFNGILDIEKVVAEKNYEFAEKAINENHIHIVI